MSDPAGPPPDQPPPYQPPPWPQPPYDAPPPPVDRWQSPRAILYGLGAGMAIYLLAYVITVAFTFAEPNASERSITALAGSFLSGSIATGVVLIAGIVLMVIRRTRILGAGVVISIALGILCGGGVCTALVVGTAG